MMELTIKEVAEKAGIANARQLAARAGIHLNSAYGLWNATATRIDLATLEKLCTLFGVVPGQLFRFEADPSVLPDGEAKRAVE
jgi:DNA-binding Xre family transcriptional regulator